MKKKYIFSLFLISFLSIFICSLNSKIAEYVFARGVYRFISFFINKIFSIIPFSVAEIILLILPFVAIIYIIYNIYKKSYKKLLINIGVILATLLTLFVFLAGTNYYREDFYKNTVYKMDKYTQNDLYNLTKSLIKDTNNNYIKNKLSFKEMTNEGKASYNKISKKYSVLMINNTNVKQVYFSKYMSYGGITGIFVPFTMEANVNTDVILFNIPFNICHEMAHLKGFMKEEEANFIAYLVCMESDNQFFNYSGSIMALNYCLNALYKNNSELYYSLIEGISKDVLIDLKEDEKYWKEIYDEPISKKVNKIMDNVNDSYLKINGQKDGVKSYGMMVDLLIGKYLYDKK